MISDNLQKAIDSLRIQDVYVRELVASCVGDFDPKDASDMDKLAIQELHFVKESNVILVDDETQLLRAFVRLGTRWVDPEEDEENEEVFVRATIEAEFIAEYLITEKLEQPCIDEFCLNNASFHVWPYWRELLSSQCARMRLPQQTLSTFQLAQNREQQSEQVSGEAPTTKR